MRIDEFDHTLVCDAEDLQSVLSYFKDYRVLPDYIECTILEIILKQLNFVVHDTKTIDDYFQLIPDEIVEDFIYNINSMFSTRQKADYTNRHLSYLLYYLPANVFKVWKPLLDLLIGGLLKPTMNILDVGTGPGSIPIGIIEFYRLLANSFPKITFSLSFTLIDAEKKFLQIAEEMINSIKEVNTLNLCVEINKSIHKKLDANNLYTDDNNFDLITMSNFLNIKEGSNYENALAVIDSLKKLLKIDGSIIIIEPGDEICSRSLKGIRNEVVNSNMLSVYSPCVGIWEEKNRYDCQCFSMVRCFWEVPRIYKILISKGLGKAGRIDIPFNYIVLRRDKRKKYDVFRNAQHYIKLADLKQRTGNKVNIKAIIRTVIIQGKNINISLCDGSCGFSVDSKAVWVNTSEEQLKSFGISIPFIAAERITLKKVLVKQVGEKIVLTIDKDTRIAIDY